MEMFSSAGLSKGSAESQMLPQGPSQCQEGAIEQEPIGCLEIDRQRRAKVQKWQEMNGTLTVMWGLEGPHCTLEPLSP